jgi:hypothetical protein
MKHVMGILLFSSLLVLTVQAQSHRISASVTTQGFVGIKLQYEYEIGPATYVGAFYQFSALMLAQGDFDTGELGFSLSSLLPIGAVSLEGLLEAGYRFQNQNLGFVQTAFINTLVKAGPDLGVFRPSLEIGWEQAIVTGIAYSEFVRETFDDIYEDAPAVPAGAIRIFPSGRLKTGLSCAVAISDQINLTVSGGMLYTPNPFVMGFDGMAFGFFPFYADLRLHTRL